MTVDQVFFTSLAFVAALVPTHDGDDVVPRDSLASR
jgi:hypothetical protein